MIIIVISIKDLFYVLTMIISQTPFRISFFGGGTDYPSYYLKHEGKTLGVSINKYCYLHVRELPPFFKSNYRIIYSKIEETQTVQEIQHPSVKAVLEYLNIKKNLSIMYDGDIPSRSGMGSSSAFTVGLLNGVCAKIGKFVSKRELARQATHIEQNLIGENVGSQDQYMTSLGGLNLLEFKKSGDVLSKPILMPKERYHQFEQSLVLVFTGISRIASTVAEDQINKVDKNINTLSEIKNLVDEALIILQDPNRSLNDFGELLHHTWQLKKGLSDKISNPKVDEMYEAGKKAGALGGKLLGAGGGGFMLFFVPPENRKKLLETLKLYLIVPFKFDESGSRIIFSAN